ncbi:hypothetical protein K431DRAFT_278106 [Polychaeton citri CBS 116435]|uniref:Uncharacterized protein n=1 Tax=Polychaeton citri CBS 116435 TaxID=1314669 RepID=A0A9P4PZV3_9PEZI|nr:hypothetical protein K431DRAFT_278106 [Polychaeton citri CBS 116435]
MPHGSLTPLGLQLKEVLLCLGSSQRPLLLRSRDVSEVHRSPRYTLPRQLHSHGAQSRCTSTAVAYVEAHESFSEDGAVAYRNDKPQRARAEQRTQEDSIYGRYGNTYSSRNSRSFGRQQSSSYNSTDGSCVKEGQRFLTRHEVSPVPSLPVRQNPSQSEVTARPPSKHQAWKANTLLRDISATVAQAEGNYWYSGAQSMGSFDDDSTALRRLVERVAQCAYDDGSGSPTELSPLTSHERSLLDGHSITDEELREWVNICRAQTSVESVERLEAYCNSTKLLHVPSWLLQAPLTRMDLQQPPFRSLVSLYIKLSSNAAALDAHLHAHLFDTFLRCIPVARQAWPPALPLLVPSLIETVRQSILEEAGPLQRLREMSYKFNKLMRLISLPTRGAPMVDAKHQEKAIVLILQHMSGHQPPLQIDREGYRAVIRLQLTFRKTNEEERWAGLKALSWPPWKEDRTGLDAEVGPEHGISRAGETLRQMQQAGYSIGGWERVAGIYAGWDSDGTPTIQTRKSMGGATSIYRDEAAIWAARINVTRTVQEAWACFLAYEDAKLSPSMDVYLETFRKLREEDRRKELEQENGDLNAPITHPQRLAGDAREILPLPPSTHLYTYTRTTPPTMDGFFRYLQAKHIELDERCVGFLVGNAPSLRDGLEYLQHSSLGLATLHQILSAGSAADIEAIAKLLLHACIRLFCRFPNVSFRRLLPDNLRPVHYQNFGLYSDDQLKMNPNNSIVFAMRLLELSPTIFSPSWNMALACLAKVTAFESMRSAVSGLSGYELSQRAQYEKSVAFAALKRLVNALHAKNSTLDHRGFLYVCYAFENIAIACYGAVRECPNNHKERQKKGQYLIWENIRTFKPTRHRAFLQNGFTKLIGVGKDFAMVESEIKSTGNLPPLLHTPDPALLHAYVRVLGWLGCYEDLQRLIQWMALYKEELTAQMDRRKNGDKMMRRTIIAVRVFLERSWLTTDEEKHPQTQVTRALMHELPARASSKAINDIRSIFEDAGEWGSWPSDEEVEEYCQDHKFSGFNRSFEEPEDPSVMHSGTANL